MLMLRVDLNGRSVLVVGGGPVAERKALALLGSGAKVRVVSPSLTPTLLRTARLVVDQRPFQPGDTAGAALVVTATSDATVDGMVAAEALAGGALVCAPAWPDLGNVHFCAEVRHGPVQIGIATGGSAPALARRIRKEIAKVVGPEYGALAELLGAARARLRAAPHLSQEERARFYRQMVEGPLLGLLADGRQAEAESQLEASLRELNA